MESAIEQDDSTIGAELLAAAREGRGEEMLRILGQDPTRIQLTDPFSDTVLHLVARGSDSGLVNQLLKFVGDHDLRKVLIEQNSEGNTPLHIAIVNNTLPSSVYFSLLKANTDAVGVVNDDGKSPSDLVREVRKGKLRVPRFSESDVEMEIVHRAIEESLDQVAYVEPCSHEEEDRVRASMELSSAVKRGQEDLVRRILETDPMLVCYPKGEAGTALHDAAKAGRVSMLRLLVGYMSPYEPLMRSALEEDKYGDLSPLLLALYRGHCEAARYLIQVSPKTGYRVNCWGVSPLHLAIEKGYHDVVLLIFQLMPVHVVSPSIINDLFAAQKKKSLANAVVKARNLGTLEVIMEALPELINISDYKGWKPLSYLAYKGFHGGVAYLLKNFANSWKNYDEDGSLPVHKAVGGGHVSIVEAFWLHSPQTLHGIDKKGRSVLHYAVMCAKVDVLLYLTKELESEVAEIYNLRDEKGMTFMDLAHKNP